MKKKKTFVITVSKNFPAGHPRAGKPTGFKAKILEGYKIHTIRTNLQYWTNIVNQVNNGDAVLSLREWSGLPYRSKQTEFLQLERLGIEKISLFTCGWVEIQGDQFTGEIETIANNDGLTFEDFSGWFKLKRNNTQNAGIIHFTDFLYEPACIL